MTDSKDEIIIRGARTHNLKNINLNLPKYKLIVFTGLSGSGKSSLAFHTLYAEGQRRYVESLSTYARQFLQQMDKPEFDLIEGLSPAISIEQKSTSHNPRSTVGTITEIYDYLRLLYARIGQPFCPTHKQMLTRFSVTEIIAHILLLPQQTKIAILAPAIVNKNGNHDEFFNHIRLQGFTKVAINQQIYDLDNLPTLNLKTQYNIDIVVDRLKIKYDNTNNYINHNINNKQAIGSPIDHTIDNIINIVYQDLRSRLIGSIETGLRYGNDKIKVFNLDTNNEVIYSHKFACNACEYKITDLEPRIFSFNNPHGACVTCNGLGHITYFDAKKIITDDKLSIANGAIKGWEQKNNYTYQILLSLAKHYKFDLTVPWLKLEKQFQDILLYGTKDLININIVSESGRTINKKEAFEGIINNLQRRYFETNSQEIKEELSKYQNNSVCHDCQGARIKESSRSILINNIAIDTVTSWQLHQCYQFFNNIILDGSRAAIGAKIINEILSRLNFLLDVGLNYITLDRASDTLSGGEAQRIRLASQIGSGLTGVMYVLDEPSIGLHQRDNDRLIVTLNKLRDLGNTVIVVEHDIDAIKAADYLVDIGALAGINGGNVVAYGNLQDIMNAPESITGAYLSNKKQIKYPSVRKPQTQGYLELTRACGNNLKKVNLKIPITNFVCITGVSGSGKSTLINDTLYKACAHHLYGSHEQPAPFNKLIGIDQFDKVINVNQSPIGRTPRSNPATYTGLFTHIRELFASLNLAKERGYQAGRFSFNVKGGRCEACCGDGLIKVSMHFLPDIHVSCDACQGKRYNHETLDILYNKKNIHDVLQMSVESAVIFFANIPIIKKKLDTLINVGLSYITLGQAATTLSGGEAQRIKLALELSKRDTGKTLYILDEPTTGLHFHDIDLLLQVLHNLVDKGNTIVVIEHNLDVIKTADWIIDMGPEGGDAGGEIIIQGSPEFIVKRQIGYTAKYLKKYL